MILNMHSWYYKLYKKTYSSPPPNNLCGFFWKLVWAMLWWPINFTWSIIPETVDRLSGGDSDSVFAEPYFSVKPIVIGICYFGVYVIICIGMGPFYPWFSTKIPMMAQFGQITLVTLAFCATFLGIRWVVLKLRKKQKHSPNILIEYIKAKKAKMCPRIEWK